MSAVKPVQGPLRGNRKVGAVMVVGGGPGGMEASLNLANAGFKVYLVEKEGAIGGRMAQLDKTFPTNDCSMCIISPKLVEVGKHMNIEILTKSDIAAIEGEEGNYRVKILRSASYIDPAKCTGCGECFENCPVSLPNEFDEKLSTRKAVFKRYPQAIPSISTITKADRAPCVLTCPANVNIQGYVALIAAGKYQEALEVIKQRNPLPSVCGRVCYHPCESKCNRNEIDEPVAINPLKRFVADRVREMKRAGELKQPEREKKGLVLKHKVAVIGSGPAGLTAAYDLAMKDYPVTIFEAMPKPGGMLYYGIPSWRLPKDILLEEIREIEDLGVEIKTGVRVGTDITFDDIRKQGYRAIFIATGAWKGRQIPLGGDAGGGVLQGVEFLKELAMGTFPEKAIKGKRVLVIGGGNVAMDVARAAVRLGAETVEAACLECTEEMPAHAFEIEQAREEGVEIHNSWGPEKILRSDGKITGMEMKRCTRVFDEEGRFSPEFDSCTLKSFDADVIILAVGQAPEMDRIDIGGDSVEQSRGLIQVDPSTLETNVSGVFAGGDGVTGPRSTIEAINQGHEAAVSIDRFLTRKDLKEGREKPDREPAPVPPGRVFPKQPREKVEELKAEDRRDNFKELETTITEEQALREAQRCLNCGLCCECKQCVEACGVEAINHDMTDRVVTLDVGSVILAPGFDLFDSQLRGEYGYGVYKNVVTSMEFERILSASGPFSGHVVRPSDHEEPKKIAWIQCVGSRDVTCGKGYCSSVCCMYATKEAIMAIDHVPGLEATVFYNDMRTYGKGYELYYESAKNKYGVKFNRGIVSSVKELQQSKNLLVKFMGEDGTIQETEFDMIVLSTGLVPCAGTRELAERVGVELNEFGFCRTALLTPGETSRKGVYVAGVFESPKDIPETVSAACSAAGLAAMNLSEVRGTLVKEKQYPPERNVTSEKPRIGVFVCHCGTNIGGVVDVPRAVEFAKTLPNVAYAERFTYTCSSDSQKKIVEAIKENKLNRVVVASCTPRTHEALFQDCLREAGINKYLFEMANIREQCSWVHKPEVERANLKAHDLIRMAVTRAARLEPLKDFTVSVNQKALVIGGGVAGMNAALNLASQGFHTTIVEKAEELGGNMARVRYLLDGSDPQAYLRGLVERVEKSPKIKVYTGTRVIDFSGHKGNFKTVIGSNGTRITVDHGIVVVATGGKEHRPQEYLYGENEKVMTQLEFESLMAEKEKDVASASSVVMIQCVGSRDKEHPFCSRVCCQQAIKNAIRIKKLSPETDVTILYRDIRTYGLFETYYKEARDLGVLFIRFEEDDKPRVTEEGGKPVVTVRDTATGFDLRFEPDYLVLSAGIRPNPDNDAVGAMLKVPRNPDGFFLEAHMKLRPLDFTTEGVYLCGLAHSPKNVSDSIVQARGAAARAAVVLSKDTMTVSGTVSKVIGEQCVACLTCVRTCPYGAPHINEQGVAEIEVAACQGCGSCAAACPRKAILVAHYKDDQITSKLDGLFEELESLASLDAGK